MIVLPPWLKERVQALVLQEVAVLGRDDRLPHQGRDLLELEEGADLLLAVLKLAAPGERGHELRLEVDILDLGSAELDGLEQITLVGAAEGEDDFALGRIARRGQRSLRMVVGNEIGRVIHRMQREANVVFAVRSNIGEVLELLLDPLAGLRGGDSGDVGVNARGNELILPIERVFQLPVESSQIQAEGDRKKDDSADHDAVQAHFISLTALGSVNTTGLFPPIAALPLGLANKF